MSYGFANRVAISFPTVLPQKSVEMCFRRRGFTRQQLILTRTLQLMRDTSSLPTRQTSFHLGLKNQGKKNLQWFLKKSITNIRISLFQSHFAEPYQHTTGYRSVTSRQLRISTKQHISGTVTVNTFLISDQVDTAMSFKISDSSLPKRSSQN